MLPYVTQMTSQNLSKKSDDLLEVISDRDELRQVDYVIQMIYAFTLKSSV